MSEEKLSFWRRAKDAVAHLGRKITGSDIKVERTPVLRSTSPAGSSDHHLFARLSREASNSAYVRQVRTDILLGKRLSDEIIRLMFNLEGHRGGNFLTAGVMKEALDQRSLATSLRVFYFYVDEQSQIPGADRISDDFYERLADLSQESTSLYRFLNERLATQLEMTRSAVYGFQPTNDDHRRFLLNLLQCQFSVCRKSFPEGLKDYIFIVGRMPLHDKEEILRHEHKQRRRNPEQAENVFLAVTAKAAGRHADNSVQFNAHRFRMRDDNSPQPEYNLFIGNWRTDWELSIGAAEHDEIYCRPLDSESARLRLNNLQRQRDRWNYQASKPALPDWITIHHRDATRDSGEGIRLCFVKPPTLDTSLLNIIDRPQFRQEISYIGRALPHSEGQLQQLIAITDRSFRETIQPVAVVAAIQVTDLLWLLNTEEGRVVRVYREGNRWSAVDLDDGTIFRVGENEYRWNNATGSLYPERFRGVLSIYPSPLEALNYKRQLNVDRDAEGFLLAYEKSFPLTMNPDPTLGERGVLRIKCVEVSDDGRGKYALMPVRDPIPTNSFFAFQPVYPREKGWPREKVWLTYDDGDGGDLRLDAEGEARYGEQRILAEEHTYHLISGTSLFQLKVSGTPYIGKASETISSPARATTVKSSLLPAATVSSEFTPTLLNIDVRLLNTKWASYRIVEADQSNFAAHFRLIHKTEAMAFLKAYFPHSAGSARRESNFYERYRARSFELFLCSPEILRMDNDLNSTDAPWALIFPHLDSNEKYFPSSSQATLPQAAAVGLGMATLFKAMAEDGIINFDIDVSQLCFDPNGRLVVVDFDNTFPLLTDPSDSEQTTPLLSILREGRLPAKNTSLPPEARAFAKTITPDDRTKALSAIGPAFSTYMLALLLLQILKADTGSSMNDEGLTLAANALRQRAASESLNPQEVARFEVLLREMLSPDGNDRPSPAEVVDRLAEIVGNFAISNEKARAESVRLLGGLP